MAHRGDEIALEPIQFTEPLERRAVAGQLSRQHDAACDVVGEEFQRHALAAAEQRPLAPGNGERSDDPATPSDRCVHRGTQRAGEFGRQRACIRPLEVEDGTAAGIDARDDVVDGLGVAALHLRWDAVERGQDLLTVEQVGAGHVVRATDGGGRRRLEDHRDVARPGGVHREQRVVQRTRRVGGLLPRPLRSPEGPQDDLGADRGEDGDPRQRQHVHEAVGIQPERRSRDDGRADDTSDNCDDVLPVRQHERRVQRVEAEQPQHLRVGVVRREEECDQQPDDVVTDRQPQQPRHRAPREDPLPRQRCEGQAQAEVGQAENEDLRRRQSERLR